jgi:hypothetical protein
MTVTFKMNDSDSARKALNLVTPWKRRERAQNEALPNAMNLWHQPVYQSPKDEYIRTGALDYKRIKGR